MTRRLRSASIQPRSGLSELGSLGARRQCTERRASKPRYSERLLRERVLGLLPLEGELKVRDFLPERHDQLIEIGPLSHL